MMKIEFKKEVIDVFKEIVEENRLGNTKVARSLIEINENGVEKGAIRNTYCNYFKFSTKNGKMFLSYIKADKAKEALKKYYGDEYEDSKMEEFHDFLFDGEEIPNPNGELVKVTRTFCKASRVLKRIFTNQYIEDNFSTRDIEYFNNQYKSSINSQVEFKVVTGEDIRKYYHEDNYNKNAPCGTLLNSCMMYDNKQEFLDVYAENSNISMLVAFGGDNKDKIIGRAILWEDVDFYSYNTNFYEENLVKEGVKFMDRIYHTFDWVTNKFKSWAKKNGYYTKQIQSHDSYYAFESPDGDLIDYYAAVELDYISHFRFPYVDTMFNPRYEDRILTNVANGHLYDNRYLKSGTALRAHENGMPRLVFDFIEEEYNERNRCKWSEYSKTWGHVDKMIHKKGDYYHNKICVQDSKGGYITPVDEVVKCVVTNEDFSKDNMVESNFHKGFIHKNDSVKVDEDYVHKSKAVQSKFLSKYLIKSKSVYLKNIDDYIEGDIIEKSGVGVEAFEQVLCVLKESGVDPTEDLQTSYVFEL